MECVKTVPVLRDDPLKIPANQTAADKKERGTQADAWKRISDRLIQNRPHLFPPNLFNDSKLKTAFGTSRDSLLVKWEKNQKHDEKESGTYEEVRKGWSLSGKSMPMVKFTCLTDCGFLPSHYSSHRCCFQYTL